MTIVKKKKLPSMKKMKTHAPVAAVAEPSVANVSPKKPSSETRPDYFASLMKMARTPVSYRIRMQPAHTKK